MLERRNWSICRTELIFLHEDYWLSKMAIYMYTGVAKGGGGHKGACLPHPHPVDRRLNKSKGMSKPIHIPYPTTTLQLHLNGKNGIFDIGLHEFSKISLRSFPSALCPPPPR